MSGLTLGRKSHERQKVRRTNPEVQGFPFVQSEEVEMRCLSSAR